MDANILTRPEGLDGWPFPVMDQNPGSWVEISEEHADYCLEVLPPIYFKGGFAVSEAQNHDANGVPTYACVVAVRGRYFARYLTLKDAEVEAVALRSEV